MVKGRLDAKASTATGYAWIVWEKHERTLRVNVGATLPEGVRAAERLPKLIACLPGAYPEELQSPGPSASH